MGPHDAMAIRLETQQVSICGRNFSDIVVRQDKMSAEN